MNLQAVFRPLIIATLLTFLPGFSNHDAGEVKKIRLMFYNVENLFDTENDPATDDEEFLPEGSAGWSRSRYLRKLNNVYKAIAASGEGDMPAVCGLCEVENRRVLEDLLNLTPLKDKYSYGIVHEDSEDLRGIDVCLIYRKDLLNLEYARYFFPEDLRKAGLKSRSILYTKWNWCGVSFHLFLNHWPSRRGGVTATEGARISFALAVKHFADSLRKADGERTAVIIAGDLNCNPGSPEEKILSDGDDSSYINLIYSLFSKGKGTYRYNGIWETPDQVLISKCLIEGYEGLQTGQTDIRIIDHQELLIRDTRYPGFRPYSTYYGFSYQGGFSDHLPVVLDLHCRR